MRRLSGNGGWATGSARYCREPDNGAGGGPGSSGAPADWRTSLPEDLRGHESLKDVKDVPALAKAFVDTKAFVGQSMRLPGPEASAEDRAAFVAKLHEKFPNAVYVPASDEEAAQLEGQLWGKLGRPADAKGYDFKDLQTAGAKLDFEDLAKTAHSMGLTRAQAKAFAQGLVRHQEAQAAAVKGWQDALKKEWGAAYSEKLGAAAEVAKKLGAPAGTLEAIKSGAMPPEQLKFFDSLVTAVGGSGRQVGDQPQGGGRVTPDEAKLRVEEIFRNPAYFDASRNPTEHQVLVKRMAELMPQAYPEEALSEEA